MEIERDVMNFTSMFKSYDGSINKTNSQRIIVLGMGGSGISGDIASALCNMTSSIQIISWKDYGLNISSKQVGFSRLF